MRVELSDVISAVSVISTGLGGVQLKVVGGLQGISAAAGVAISGLSISVAAGIQDRLTTWHWRGRVPVCPSQDQADRNHMSRLRPL